jgi:hypothetical protein
LFPGQHLRPVFYREKSIISQECGKLIEGIYESDEIKKGQRPGEERSDENHVGSEEKFFHSYFPK